MVDLFQFFDAQTVIVVGESADAGQFTKRLYLLLYRTHVKSAC